MKIKVVLPNVKGKSSIFKLASQRLHNFFFVNNTQIEVQFICSKVHTSPCFSSMTLSTLHIRLMSVTWMPAM